MARPKLMLIAIAAAIASLLPTTFSSAQDGPTLIVDPPYVESPGEYTFIVTGEGWTATPPYGVLACPDLVDQTTCHRESGVTVTELGDGAFTAEIIVQVPPEGIYIGAGDFAETQAAAVKVTIGMVDEELPATGVNTSLPVVIGAGIALAGVMVFGLSRRLCAR